MALLLHGLFRYGFAAGCEAAALPRRSCGLLNRALPLDGRRWLCLQNEITLDLTSALRYGFAAGCEAVAMRPK